MQIDDRLDLAVGAKGFIAEHFPELMPRLEGGQPLSLGYGAFDGVCSEPDAARVSWCEERGFLGFLEDPVPEGFAMIGLQNRGIAEKLVALWALGSRRFWFQDAYVVFTRDSGCSKAFTRYRLAAMLQRWESGREQVVYSWPHGVISEPPSLGGE